MSRTNIVRTRFEGAEPIPKVTDMSASLQYYVDVLGFKKGEWGSDDFTAVARDIATHPSPTFLAKHTRCDYNVVT